MRLQSKLFTNSKTGLIGAGLSILVGMFLLVSPLGEGLENLSYDLPFLFGLSANFSDQVCRISMDETSYQKMDQHYGQAWDRALHAQVLDRLTEDKAKMVVFDVFFTGEGNKDADARLSEALKRNGWVILGAVREFQDGIHANGYKTTPPLKAFEVAAKGWGVVSVLTDADITVRQFFANTENTPSLPLAAAELYAARSPDSQPFMASLSKHHDLSNMWLNYYGPSCRFDNVSYHQVTNMAPGTFAGKVVFIGQNLKTKFPGDQTDEFRSPFTRFGEGFWPGVKIEIIAFLNLIRGDWLVRTSEAQEFFLILLSGGFFGFGLCPLKPLTGAWVSLVGFVCVGFAAVCAVWWAHIWFPWLIVAAIQIPCAYLWSIIAHTRRLQKENQRLERSLAPEPEQAEQPLPVVAGVNPKVTAIPQPSTKPIDVPVPSRKQSTVIGDVEALVEILSPQVPDHTLLRIVGKGSYGEVWLATTAIKTYHAVKVVHRKTFRDAGPFEREFRGMQKFTPISRTHPGWVHVLHVGPNNPVAYFYYVMEIADDETSGQSISPASYKPKTLRSELEKKGTLPFSTCVEMALALASALEFLHRNKLIHRDIKPSNVIYVNGAPKLADIGLITDIGTKGKEVTYVGTEGYIPPEGPGAATADIYSLGKVLYVASMGLPASRSPDLPTWVMGESEENTWLLRFNEILVKACERNVEERYQSAGKLHADLLLLQHRYHTEQKTRT